ncbi:MAG: hypothetical protein R3190_19795, partial [Thermoanaerobaculia bacterium]|nr:hypothetical protein [Thermoanaerobaculia bacterium]
MPSTDPVDRPAAGGMSSFEELVAGISATLIATEADEIDGVLERALREVVESLDLDRSTLSQFCDEGQRLETTHSWAGSGIERMPQTL